MNRMHRFGASLFHVGLAGAGVAFLALMNAFALPSLFWGAIIVIVACGVIVGVGYVIQERFNDLPWPTDAEPDDLAP